MRMSIVLALRMGAVFCPICFRMDKPKVIAAVAYKLALLIYAPLSNGEEYTKKG
jgi:transposase